VWPDLAKMAQSFDNFYDDMAAAYHLIFADWNVTIERQQAVLSRLLPPPTTAGMVLDCACGIGTQALRLARVGYTVSVAPTPLFNGLPGRG